MRLVRKSVSMLQRYRKMVPAFMRPEPLWPNVPAYSFNAVNNSLRYEGDKPVIVSTGNLQICSAMQIIYTYGNPTAIARNF